MVDKFRQFWYVPVLVIALGLMSIRLLVFARLLNINDYGIYSAGLLISSSFIMLGCLGLYSLLQRDQPMMLVRGRELAASILLLQCIIVAISCCLVASSITAVNDLSLAGLPSPLVILSLIHGLSNQLFLVVSLENRSRGQTLLFATQNLVRAFSVLFAGVIAAVLFRDATSILIAEVLTTLLIFLYILRNRFYNITVGFLNLISIALTNLSRINWTTAFTLFVVNIGFFVFVNLDRWIISEKFTPYVFGQYAFSWVVISIAQSVQMVIHASVFPMLARVYASSGELLVFKKTIKLSLATLFVGIILAGPLFYMLDYSILRWFENYSQSRYFLPVFIIISVFRLSDFWSSYLIIVGKENYLLFINFLIVILGALFWQFFIDPGPNSIEPLQIAFLSLVLTMAGYGFVMLYVFHHAFSQRKLILKKIIGSE
jgi:O-antigen/teichoic acid export membrane protein